MNHKMRRCLLVAVLTLACASTARAQEYRSGRVSDLRGNLAVRGEQEDDVSYLERNSVIREGDTLWTDDDGRAEIELERGAWVRLAEGTKLEIRNLPPSGEFRLWTGSVYFDVSERIETPIRLKTPVGDVDIEPDSVVRVDLNKSESARVSVWNGRARVYPEHGSSLRVAVGERAYLEADRPLEDPRRFDRADLDGFDRYHRDRIDYYINRPLPRELDRDVLGARDLNDYGTWVVVENVNYWRPRCDVGWRPYSTGYWSWMPGFGYTWIDYHPWGYTTCHYGGWSYRPVYGWLWCPSYAWRPAYVSWGRYGDYYGWCPLDPWGQPAYFPGSGFSLAFGTGNFFIDFRSWTFCDRDRFYYGRHHWRQWPDFDRRGRRQFFSANDISAKNFGFSLVGDAARDFGAPKSQVRGLTFGANGRLARDSVLNVERKLPAMGLKRIENRFGVPAQRDRQFVERPSDITELQRGTGLKIEDRHLVRGDDAGRRLFQPGRPAGDPAGGGSGLKPTPIAPQPGGADNPGDRNKPGLGLPRPGDRPGENPERPGLGVKPGFRPGQPNHGDGTPGGVKSGNQPGDRPGFKPGERTFDRPGVKPGDRPGFGPGSRDQFDRDSPFRRGGSPSTSPSTSPDRGDKRPSFQPGPRNDNSRPAERSQPKESPARRSEPERRSTPDRDSSKPKSKSTDIGDGDDRRFGLVEPGRSTGEPSGPRSDSPFRRGDVAAGSGNPFDRPSGLRGSEPPVSGGDDRIRKPDPPKPGGSFRDFGPATGRPSFPSSPAERDSGFRRGSDSDDRSPFVGRPSTGTAPEAPRASDRSSFGGSSRSPFGSTPDRAPSYDRSPSYDRGSGSRPSFSSPPASRNYEGGSSRGSFGGSSNSGGSSRSYSPPSGGSNNSRSYNTPSGGGSSSGSRGSFGGGRFGR